MIRRAFRLIELLTVSKIQRKAFNLVELMFSILILGIGLVAVAGLFPIAGTMQASTFEDMLAREVAFNAQSLLTGRGFHVADLALLPPPPPPPARPRPPGFVEPMPPSILREHTGPRPVSPLPPIPLIVWTLQDRSYVYPTGPLGNNTDQAFYWVPMRRQQSLVTLPPTLTTDAIYLLVLKKDRGADYLANNRNTNTFANPDDPEDVPRIQFIDRVIPDPNSGSNPSVMRLEKFAGQRAGEFQVGDYVLDSQGAIFKLVDVRETSSYTEVQVTGLIESSSLGLWYAPRASPTSKSPLRYITQVNTSVIDSDIDNDGKAYLDQPDSPPSTRTPF